VTDTATLTLNGASPQSWTSTVSSVNSVLQNGSASAMSSNSSPA